MNSIKNVIKRSGVTVPFQVSRISNAIYRAAVSVGGRDKKTADWLTNQVIMLLNDNQDEEYTPHIEEIQDLIEKVLIENGHAKVAKSYILYRKEAEIRRHSDSKRASIPGDNIPWAKLWYVLDWAESKKVNTITNYNSRIANGEFSQIVHESELAYEQDLDLAAETILEKIDNLKMVFISGPSSSGKTTTTFKLEQRLKNSGIKFVPLIVDNYFFDLEMHPKDEFGDYDFETPQALDLKLINDHLSKITNGEEIKIPFYDFKTGTRKLNQTPLKLNDGEILLIDSLHGLYPQFSESISDENKFKIYIEPLLQMKDENDVYIRWTDIRLIRRMLRDSVQRAYNPQQTLEHWHYVRSSEIRNIFQHIKTADYIINSAMPYEMSIYAERIRDEFNNWTEKFRNDPLKEDAFTRAERLSEILNKIQPVSKEHVIPHDSVIREFIGGSSFSF